MPSLFATTCWPNQFLAKWLAVFFGALVVGIFLPAVLHRTSAPQDVQASIKVLVQFGPQPPRSTLADISQVDSAGGKWDSSKVFTVAPSGTQKSLVGGQVKYFKVWPKNSVGQYEGDPQDWTITWPDKLHERSTLTTTIVRTYPQPNWHH